MRRQASRYKPLIGVLAAAVLAAGVAAPLAGCGGDDGPSGGEITIAHSSQPDSLDPARSFTVEVWEATWLVYTPLLTYRRAEGERGTELIPGLAEQLPEVSEDGRTYRLTLREGLSYADGTPATASDFERTIQRVLRLESEGGEHFAAIEGAEEYIEGDDPEAEIAGIETDDESGEITIELSAPNAAFANVLALPVAGLVPGDTPFRDLAANPPPGIGPYTITESDPNRRFVMERSETFQDLEIPDIPVGEVDRITVQITGRAERQAQGVLDGELDYMQATPPPDLLGEVRERAGDRFAERAGIETLFFFLNTEEEPFDDIRVRQAANYALDRAGLARLHGGLLQPGCSLLPPGMPGYDEELDTSGCPWGDPSEPPDLERARELVREAGAEGAEVEVWGLSDEPTNRVTEAYAEMLAGIGLDAQPEIIDGAVYFPTVGDPSTRAQTGFAGWSLDFLHPLSFYVLVEGGSPFNLSRLENPTIDAEIERLRGEPDLAAVTDEWRQLERELAETAALAPYGHPIRTTFLSERMDFEAARFHPVFQNDYSSFAIRDE